MNQAKCTLHSNAYRDDKNDIHHMYLLYMHAPGRLKITLNKFFIGHDLLVELVLGIKCVCGKKLQTLFYTHACVILETTYLHMYHIPKVMPGYTGFVNASSLNVYVCMLDFDHK